MAPQWLYFARLPGALLCWCMLISAKTSMQLSWVSSLYNSLFSTVQPSASNSSSLSRPKLWPLFDPRSETSVLFLTPLPFLWSEKCLQAESKIKVAFMCFPSLRITSILSVVQCLLQIFCQFYSCLRWEIESDNPTAKTASSFYHVFKLSCCISSLWSNCLVYIGCRFP